jgi:hypothetical protein
VGTTTLLQLDQKVLEATGDWLQVTLTTAIGASKLLVSTTLNNYDRGQNGIFDRYWVYIEDYANAGTSRWLGSTTYATSSGTAYVYGANLTTDSANKATVRISRSSWANRKDAIARAIGELYPLLYKSIDDRTLILGNALPNSHLEDETSGTPTHTSLTNVTAAAWTTAGEYRGPRGSKAIKLTATSSNGYMSWHSDDNPQLLDLKDQTVTLKGWALPEMANDGALVIYTKQADGTTQTLTSSTLNPASEYTQLSLEDQALNDDLVEIEIRCKVATNTKYVIFDDIRLNDFPISDYRLPDAFNNGNIEKVEYQTIGYASDMCDDISLSATYTPLYGWEIIDDGLYKYLRVPSAYRYLQERRLKITGTQPYEALTAAAHTVATNSVGEISLIVAYAAYLLHEAGAGPVSADDTEKYDREMAKYYGKYQRLLMQHSKPTRSGTIQVAPL